MSGESGVFGACCGVPDSYRVVLAGGGEEFPSTDPHRADCSYWTGVSGESGVFGAGVGIPDSNGVVPAGGGEEFAAVHVYCADRSHRAGVSGESGVFGAGRRIPDPYGAVVAGGGEEFPPTHAHRTDRVDPVGVSGESGVFGAGRRIPDPYRPVIAGRGEEFPPTHAHRTHRPDRVGVSGEDGVFVPRAGPRPPDPEARRCWERGGVEALRGRHHLEHRRPLDGRRGDRSRTQPEQPRVGPTQRGGGVVGGGDQPLQVGVQQVLAVGQNLVDDATPHRVAGQEPQQIRRCVPPASPLPVHEERLRQRPLVARAVISVLEQSVVERLVKEQVGGDLPVLSGLDEEVRRTRAREGRQILFAQPPTQRTAGGTPQVDRESRSLRVRQCGQRLLRRAGRAEPVQVRP